MSIGSSVSSTRCGSPHLVPVAAASTYNQRGVITATPKDKLLGLIRCTRDANRSPLYRSCDIILCLRTIRRQILPSGGRGGANYGTPFTTNHEQAPAGAGADRETE